MKVKLRTNKMGTQVDEQQEPFDCNYSIKLFVNITFLFSLLFLDVLGQAPTVISFTPTSGPIGTTVTITGTNFSTTPANNIVYFGATRATVTAATSTQLTVTVPAGATYQSITVLCNNLIAYSQKPFITTLPGAGATSSFGPLTTFNVNASPMRIVVADVNLDGKPDALTVNQDANTVSIRLGDGTGSFSGTTEISVGSYPQRIAVADINNDGKLDFVTSNLFANSVSVRLGDGLGGFTGVSDFLVGTSPFGLVVTDVNLDGKPDILCAASSVSLLLGDGTGNFPTHTVISVGPFPTSTTDILVADINSDNKPDLLAANAARDEIAIRIGDGLGGFSGTSSVSVTGAGSIYLSDLNSDGFQDLVCANVGLAATSVHLGDGLGGFSSPSYINDPPIPANVTLADISSDGKLDLITPYINNGDVGIRFGDGTGVFSNPSSNVSPIGTTTGVFVADVNLDGKQDLLIANKNFNRFSIALNTTLIPPTITNFTPTSGPIGTIVTITGANFDPTPANNIVYFGATRATVISATTTQLIVTVPTGATYQPITVQVAGLTGFSSKPFVVTFTGGGSIDECSFAPPVVFGTVGGDPIANTVGDLDGDGKTDLIMCDRSGTTLSVFRNTSTPGIVNSGSFASKIDFTTPSGPMGAAFGDLDGDGKPDLAIVSYATGIMSVFRNTSTPGIVSLGARADFSAPGFTSNIAIYDLDGDGKSEIIISSTFAGITVYRNSSVAGTLNASSFANGINFPTATNPFPFSVADLDGDNKPDLTVPIANTHTTEVMRNTSTTGTISFAPSVTLITGLGTPPLGLGATYAATGDIDSDNKQDIVVTNYALGTFAVFRNTSSSGSLSFESRVELTSSGPAGGPNLADLDGDAKIDLVGAGTNFISLFKNLSSVGVINTGSFGSRVSITLPIGEAMSIADIDGDGRNDIVTKSTNVSILRNVNGLISPPTITSFTPTSGPIGTSVTITGTNFSTPFTNTVKINGITATINSSTATTLTVTIPVGATSGPFDVTIGCNTVTSGANFLVGTFIPTITSFSPASGPIGTTVTITGTNFDTTPANNIVMFNGTVASVTASTSTNITATVPTGATTGPVSVTVGANTATSTSNFIVAPFNIAFTAPLSVTVGSTPREVVVGDIDGDGHKDLVVSNFGSGSISFLKGIGNGCFQSAQNFTTGPNSHGLALADLNQDSKLDLVVTKGAINTSSLSVLLGNGTTFDPQSDYSTSPIPRSPNHANVGDMNKDGWPDLIVANENPSGSYSILYNNGNGTFATGVDFPSANGSAFFVATDDVNGDTFPDVAIASYFNNTASIYINDGLGGFTTETTYPSAAGPHYVILKDLTGDNRPEMIIANALANSISVFQNNGTGSFSTPAIYVTGNYPTTLSVADMDNDGKLDLVVGNANGGTITAFPGDGAGGFGASKNFSVGGQPYSIATGDFDEDGNLDVVSVDLSSNKITLLRTLSNTCLPNIASFSPISGPAGTSVVISGMNFSSIPANNVVMFNGVTAVVSASNATSITAVVPSGATTGTISVTVAGNTATSTNSFAVTCVPIIEKNALVAFYNANDGANWQPEYNSTVGTQSAWLSPNDVSTWFLVTVRGCHVTKVLVDPSNLVGNLVIPTEFKDLTFLDTLVISGGRVFTAQNITRTQLTGSIPKEIGEITSLKLLTISGNFSGTLPKEIGNLTQLKQLRIYGGHSLTGDIPTEFSNLINLTGLTLQGGQYVSDATSGQTGLTGNVPLGVANLPSLAILDLSENQLSGPLPPTFTTTLLSVNLGGNNFTGTIPTAWISLSNLRSIFLFRNQLTGSIPPFFGNLSLNQLNIRNNNLTGVIPASFQNITTMQNFQIQNNQLEGKIPDSFGSSVSFAFRIENNKISQVPKFTHPSLTQIRVENNALDFGSLELNVGRPGYSYIPQGNLAGGTASASVGGTLNIPFTTGGTQNIYQWYKDGSPISGATSQQYSKSNAQLIDAGNYTVQVTNTLVTGITLTSNVFVVTISNSPPSTIVDFDPKIGSAGTTITITGTNFTSATAVTFGSVAATSFTIVSPTSITAVVGSGASGNVSVTTPAGTATLAGFTFVPTATITISPQPTSISVCEGVSAAFTVAASGTTNILYQWQKFNGSIFTDVVNGGVYSGATSAAFNINTTGNFGGGDYRCRVSGDFSPDVFSNTVTLTINTLPATPGVISGTTTICSSSSNSYSIAAVSGATSYTWTLPSGWTGTSTTNSITATAGASAGSGNITVTGSNACGTSPASTQTVTVNTIPVAPGAIVGLVTICAGATNPYSVSAVSGATSYTWLLPSGWTGTSTTNSINATASASAGNITVTASNSCGISLASTLAVTVNTAPAAPVAIAGTSTICAGSSNIYSIAAVGGATTYTWSLPSGWTGTSNSTSINSTATAIGGNITVAASNACGTSAAQTLLITVNPLPAAPAIVSSKAPVSGKVVLCTESNETTTLSTSPTGFLSYNWGVGGSAPSITVGQSASVTVRVTDANGCQSLASTALVIDKTSCKPSIASATLSTTAGSVATQPLAALVTVAAALDLNSLKVTKQPASGAVATISSGGVLSVNYAGISFVGSETITIEACDINGICSQQDLTIEVAGDVIVFNAISPNGDNKNEFIRMQYIESIPDTKSNKVMVFNRWGDLVFEINDYDNADRVFRGLDNNGDKLAVGTYYYRIDFTSGRSSKTGFISLRK